MSKLLDGVYKTKDNFYKILKKNEDGNYVAVDGPGIEYPVKIEYGDFGEADPKVQELSGLKNYNIKLSVRSPKEDEEEKAEESTLDMTDIGIIYEEGRKCSMYGPAGVSGLEKITEEEMEEIMNDCDPIEAPPGPYKVQPEKEGKIIWFTGAPGMGKSTSAQLLARNHGYVYYEADCFGALKNPYVPLDLSDPTMGQMYQKTLRGPGVEERLALMKRAQPVWEDLMKGREYDNEAISDYYRHLAEDIAREKGRIGGDFAIAHVLFNAEGRKVVRDVLGPDVIIIVLTMSNDDRRERILARHSGNVTIADMLDEVGKLMEGVTKDEPNTFEFGVDSKMTRDEVVVEIMKKIDEMK